MKILKEYINDAARAYTAISLLAAAQELLEQANRDARVNHKDISMLVKRISKLRASALMDLDAATEMILTHN